MSLTHPQQESILTMDLEARWEKSFQGIKHSLSCDIIEIWKLGTRKTSRSWWNHSRWSDHFWIFQFKWHYGHACQSQVHFYRLWEDNSDCCGHQSWAYRYSLNYLKSSKYANEINIIDSHFSEIEQWSWRMTQDLSLISIQKIKWNAKPSPSFG